MATLYLRDGIYYLNYTINGQRRRKALSEDRQEAELRLAEYNYNLKKGTVPQEKPKVTLGSLIKRYFQTSQLRLAKSTQKRYRDALDHFEGYLYKHRPIEDVTQINRTVIAEYIDFRLRCKPKPKSNTVNNELRVLSILFRFAVDCGYLDFSPLAGVRPLKNPDAKKGRVLSPEEIRALLDACGRLHDGEWFRQIIVVFLNTGMRLGELINLTWDDIDLERRQIHIQEKPFWSPKSYARVIPVNQVVFEIISSLRANHPGQYVFTLHGKQIPVNRLRKRLLTLAKLAKLPHISRIHDFRHTCASNLLMAGVDIPSVSALLGHRSWSTTAIYAHQTTRHLEAAMARMVPHQ